MLTGRLVGPGREPLPTRTALLVLPRRGRQDRRSPHARPGESVRVATAPTRDPRSPRPHRSLDPARVPTVLQREGRVPRRRRRPQSHYRSASPTSAPWRRAARGRSWQAVCCDPVSIPCPRWTSVSANPARSPSARRHHGSQIPDDGSRGRIQKDASRSSASWTTTNRSNSSSKSRTPASDSSQRRSASPRARSTPSSDSMPHRS